MKIVQVPYCFYPDPAGGTEVYTCLLAKHLVRLGEEAVIAAPAEKEAVYRHEGLVVRRFGFAKKLSLDDLYGEGDAVAAASFGRLLDEERPHLVHFQAFSPGVSLRALREAKKRNIRTVLTYQTPTVSCQRGSLMRWGRAVCDGKQRVHLCSQCTLHGLGLPLPAAFFLGGLPLPVSALFGKADLEGGVWTALRMVELMKLRHETFQKFIANVDQLVAIAEWVKSVLILNGVPAAKIALRHNGMENDVSGRGDFRGRLDDKDVLKLAFLGRMDPTKGLDILIRAVRCLPHEKIHLDVFGVVQSQDMSYVDKMKKIAGGDGRIYFHDAIPHDQVVSRLQRYDFLAIPSRWMEAWPTVILEAFAAGVPVIGTRQGGILEMVNDGVDGILVNPTAEAWRDVLLKACQNSEWRLKLRQGVTRPKDIRESAAEMKELYSRLVFGQS